MPYEECGDRKDGPRDEDRVIAERVRAVRRLRGVTQTELGDVLGVSFQQIQKYERAINRISGGSLFLIAKALATDVATFFEGLEHPAAREIGLDVASLSDADLRDIRVFLALPIDVRRALGGVFSTLSDRTAFE